MKPEKNNHIFSAVYINAAALCGCAILAGTLVLMAGVWWNHFLPSDTALQNIVITSWAHLVRPEREMMLYHLWLVSTAVIQGALVVLFRRQLEGSALSKKIVKLFVFELILISAVILFFGIKIGFFK